MGQNRIRTGCLRSTRNFRMAIAAPHDGMLDKLLDVSAIRASAARAACAVEATEDIKRRAQVAEQLTARDGYGKHLYKKEVEAASRFEQIQYLSIGAKKWLDLMSMCEVGYLDFSSRRAEIQINADQNYVTSHPVINDGDVWEKYLVEQLDAYEGQLADSNLRWWTPTDDEYVGGPKHLHAIAQTWAKLRLLRTPLEFLDHGTRRIVAEVRNEHFDAPAARPVSCPRCPPTLTVLLPELANLGADIRAIAEHAIARECLATLKIKPPQGSDPHSYALGELRRYPELFCDAVRTGLERSIQGVANGNLAREHSLGLYELVDGDEQAIRFDSNNVVMFPRVPKVGAGTRNLNNSREFVPASDSPATSDRMIEVQLDQHDELACSTLRLPAKHGKTVRKEAAIKAVIEDGIFPATTSTTLDQFADLVFQKYDPDWPKDRNGKIANRKNMPKGFTTHSVMRVVRVMRKADSAFNAKFPS